MSYALPLMLTITVFILILVPVTVLNRLRRGVWFWTDFILRKTGVSTHAVVIGVSSTEMKFTVNREAYGWHILELDVTNPITSAVIRVKKKYLAPMDLKNIKKKSRLPLLVSAGNPERFIIDLVSLKKADAR